VLACLEQDADLHMAQLMPLPLTVSCFSKIQIGFKCVCVCVCVLFQFCRMSSVRIVEKEQGGEGSFAVGGPKGR